MKRTKQDILASIDKEILTSKIVANNTLRINYANGSEAIRLHDTDVVTKLPNGHIILDSGSWRTSTTKDRINNFSPVRVYQDKGVWYVGGSMFFDGMIVDPEGKVINPKEADIKAITKTKRMIAAFVKQITKENLPVPSPGDCWLCCTTSEGETLGRGTCISEHLKENYLHGSLLVNAMRSRGFSDDQIRLHYSMRLVDTFRRAVRQYVQKFVMPDVATR